MAPSGVKSEDKLGLALLVIAAVQAVMEKLFRDTSSEDYRLPKKWKPQWLEDGPLYRFSILAGHAPLVKVLGVFPNTSGQWLWLIIHHGNGKDIFAKCLHDGLAVSVVESRFLQ